MINWADVFYISMSVAAWVIMISVAKIALSLEKLLDKLGKSASDIQNLTAGLRLGSWNFLSNLLSGKKKKGGEVSGD